MPVKWNHMEREWVLCLRLLANYTGTAFENIQIHIATLTTISSNVHEIYVIAWKSNCTLKLANVSAFDSSGVILGGGKCNLISLHLNLALNCNRLQWIAICHAQVLEDMVNIAESGKICNKDIYKVMNDEFDTTLIKCETVGKKMINDWDDIYLVTA